MAVASSACFAPVVHLVNGDTPPSIGREAAPCTAGGHSESCHTLSIARVLRTLRMDCINPMQLARWRE